MEGRKELGGLVVMGAVVILIAKYSNISIIDIIRLPN
jgi:hypothetical protein